MYDNGCKIDVPVANNPKHLEEAANMADLIYPYPPSEQNEMIKHIHSMIRNKREKMIEEMKKELEYLSQMLNEL
jgi:hypothetical protein